VSRPGAPVWLLRLAALYPRRWRDRYGEELAALLEEQRATPALIVDLLRGALDAHLHLGELVPEAPEPALRRAAGTLVQALALALLAVAAMTKATEDGNLATDAASDAARAGSALAAAGALALAAPTALGLLAAASRARRRPPWAIVGMAVPAPLFLGVTIGLSALAPGLGGVTATIAFWGWALAGAVAVAVTARTCGTAVRKRAPHELLAGLWPAAWVTAAGVLLALAGVTAWSLSALTTEGGVALGGVPASLIASASTVASVAATALVWRSVRAGQTARGALAADR
jgi:hypothetical protein